MRKLLIIFSALLCITAACSSQQRQATLTCDEAALTALKPQIAAAIAAKDTAALKRLVIEDGAESVGCAIKSLEVPAAAGGGSGSASP